jgi:hypothetical protein
MSIDLRWYDHDCILLAEYYGMTSFAEQRHATDRLIEIMNVSPHTIHVIADFRRATSYPFCFDLMGKTNTMLRHKNTGWFAVLGINPVLDYWTTIFSKTGGLRYSACDSLDDALKFLRSHSRMARPAQVCRV